MIHSRVVHYVGRPPPVIREVWVLHACKVGSCKEADIHKLARRAQSNLGLIALATPPALQLAETVGIETFKAVRKTEKD